MSIPQDAPRPQPGDKFGRWLRYWRQQRQITAADLARAIDVTTWTVLRWEKHPVGDAGVNHLPAIADALGFELLGMIAEWQGAER